jgi:hypothetical protein
MADPSKREQHTGNVCGFSSSGNPVVKKRNWDKRAVIVTSDSDEFSKGDSVKFTIQKEHSDHYQSSLIGEGGATVSKPNYSSSPNISIHHDGKYGESVGDTRSEKETNASPSERENDPETHGAPEISKNKRERKFLRQNNDEQ